MSFKDQLKEEIRELRANYQELERILPFDTLTGEQVAVHPKSKDFLSHLEKVLNGSKRVENFMRKWVLQEQKAMLLLPDEDKQYLETVVRSRYVKVRELFIQYHPDGWWEDFVGELEPAEVGKDSTDIALTMTASLNFYDDTVDEDDDRRIDVFDFTGAEEVVESPYFTPDQWRSNAIALQPVTQREHDALIPADARRRLEATYASFVFGNWFACVAMARTALEYALRSRAATTGATSYPSGSFEKEESLDLLIRRIVDKGFSELFDPMERIRKRGNAVMHPTKIRTLSSPDRQAALGVVRDLRYCIEKLFAK